ncbi:membrane-associated phospholipid phosphatase [Aquipluma nitroreducens]|uniref:Membrane-associated phospholipid phosphatase n=1 Tax=Aquipluma nitroreducens TaxID=2010828 RepID=A0A5K7S9P8_9BACT|nr:phosphatase PAP2 family protein [Aquipluma nitroreducens]BBE18186.1 membrane-associated phospholipid phosphatase [Aquipluma nitroreducens]
MKQILLFLLLLLSATTYSQNLDIRILRQINEHRNVHLDGTFKTISTSVSPISIGAPILIFGTGLIKKDQELRQKGLMIGESFLVTTVFATALKHAVNRARPFETYPDIQKLSAGGSSSFPSGHTSDVFSTATSLSLAFPKWYVIAPCYTYAALVGYSRMHLGVHYPSDVLAGAVVGAGSAFLCYKAQKWLNHRNRKKQNKPIGNL